MLCNCTVRAQFWAIEIKEQGACALWALAGEELLQQRDIADRIGIQLLIELALAKSEKLQLVGARTVRGTRTLPMNERSRTRTRMLWLVRAMRAACEAMRALCFENALKQEQVLRESGVIFLMRLLRSHTSDRVVCSCVRLLGTLCLAPAHTANERVQLAFAEANLVPLLAEFVRASSSSVSVELRVQVRLVPAPVPVLSTYTLCVYGYS